MTNKPYISCPLSAALAAKNFGFKFVNRHTESDPNNGVDYGGMMDGLSSIHHSLWAKPLYIHDDSLPLLQPMVGDLIAYKGEPMIVESIETPDPPSYIVYYDHLPKKLNSDVVIIQRNGLPFPKIQYEES